VQAAAGFITGGQAPTADPPEVAAGAVADPEPLPVAAVPRPPKTTAAPAAGRKATMSRRRTGKEVRQLTVYLEPDVERQLKLVAVEEDRLPSDVIADALRAYFAARR